jgi:nitrous oxide reductase
LERNHALIRDLVRTRGGTASRTPNNNHRRKDQPGHSDSAKGHRPAADGRRDHRFLLKNPKKDRHLMLATIETPRQFHPVNVV